MPYLFGHFREKTTADGEQVYFAVSENGTFWRQLNSGEPVIKCQKGEMGCRDIEVVRLKSGGFVVIATDLCIANRADKHGMVDWNYINHNGSKFLSLWRSEDLIHFSRQELLDVGAHDFGCLWAPEVFYDEEKDEYLLHFSGSADTDDGWGMGIYAVTTKDFKSFTEPKPFFLKNGNIIDSHIVKTDGVYHLFYKDNGKESKVAHAVSTSLWGEYKNDCAFEKKMMSLNKPGSYEAPTTFILPDGRWCLMIDFFGCEKDKMGYVPFVSDKPGDADFAFAGKEFNFPYGFKHGGVIEITFEEYDKLIEFYK